MADGFADRYGRPAEVLVRAPGRVNLIGEHTDYNGFPVLPIAIDRCVYIAAAPRQDRAIHIDSVDPRFAARRYALQPPLTRFPAGDWGNYHQAAVHGLIGACGEAGLRGGDFLVAADLPSGAGLASSAALVVGSMLALLGISGRTMDRLPLAALAASAERYVGTQSGGMDQAICLLAEPGHALRIDFDPLRARPVPMGDEMAIAVCDSLVSAEKSGAARAAYNARVAECRLACRVLEHALGADDEDHASHLGELRERHPDRSLADLRALLERVLPAHPLTLDEIGARIGVPADDLAMLIGGSAPVATYPLLQRARHVLSEADRVERAEIALAARDWAALGALMDASHASCRDDYEVSSPALEALVAAAKNAGALGARLTGAGFGGCTVNLVPADQAAAFLARVERDYYASNPAAQAREHSFIVRPSGSAEVVERPGGDR